MLTTHLSRTHARHRRIRADLERRGHRFRTRSDSEIALHLYEEYGPECLHHLRGEYAFVLAEDRGELDALAAPGVDANRHMVADQTLTLALSNVFMHEGLGLSA